MMHGPINVKSPNNTSKWHMGFNSAFKGLKLKRFFGGIADKGCAPASLWGVGGRVLTILSYRHSMSDDKTSQAADKSQPSNFRFVWGS
jgi:hypothetical protein